MAFVVLIMRSRLAAVSALLVAMGAASASSAQVVTTYAYDPQGQVTGVNRGGSSATYSYDQAGNRIGVAASGSFALKSAALSQSSALVGQVEAPAGQAEAMARLHQPPSGDRFIPGPPSIQPPGPLPPAMIKGVIVAHPPNGAGVASGGNP